MKQLDLSVRVEEDIVKKTKTYAWTIFTDDSLRRKLRLKFMSYVAGRSLG